MCDTIVYHPTITRLIKFFDAAAGREKVLRLLQYLCRFLSIEKGGPTKQLERQFLLIRKVLRFLKPLNYLKLASKVYDNKLAGDAFVRYCNVWKNLAFALYLALDQINLLRMLKVISSTSLTGKMIPKWTNQSWLLSLFLGILMNGRKIQIAQRHIDEIKNAKKEGSGKDTDKDEEKKVLATVTKERYSAIRKLLWDSLDSLIVMNNLSYLKLDDGYTGLIGITTSLLGMQDLWKATE